MVGLHSAQAGAWRMADDDDFSDAEPSSTEAIHSRNQVTLMVVGYLDAGTSRQLRESVDELLLTRPLSITIDASRVTYADPSGLGALLSVRHAMAKEAGLDFRIVDPSPALRRVVELAGFTELLGVADG
jgi:anti-anti-sigma factor